MRFSLAQLLGSVGVCGVVFAIWPHLKTPPSPLENLPQVKLGMSEAEVESLVGKAECISIGGGLRRATHHYWDETHSAQVVFWSGEGVTEVQLDGKLISPPLPRNRLWAEVIAVQRRKEEQLGTNELR